jgi:hypothetical protein
VLDEKAVEPVVPRRGLAGLLPYALDLVLPIAAYFGLKTVGVSDFWALVIGGLLTAANTGLNTIRRGKLDSLGVLVLVEVALGIGLMFADHDARLILARPSLYIGVAGVWVLVKAFSARPITVDASKPMAYKGDPRRLEAYEQCAARCADFRRVHRNLSVLWGVVFLLYAVMRLVIIYSVHHISESVWLTEVPGVVGIVICLLAAKNAGEKLEKMVDNVQAGAIPVS